METNRRLPEASRSPLEKNIARLFEEQAARTPQAIAAIAGQESMKYRELDARSNRLAHCLRDMGAGPETLVGLAIDRSNDMLVAMLAILKSGGAYVPIDPTYPSARIALMIEDSQLRFLLTTERIRAKMPAGSARILSIDGEAEAISKGNSGSVAPGGAENNLAYVIYTSGSTGKPKGVMVEHRNVLNFFAGMDELLGVDPGTWLAVTSISFDISVLELLWTLARGFTVVIHPEGNSDKISSEIIRHGVTHLQMTPSLLRAVASDPQSLEALGKLKTLLIGGEALPASLIASLRPSFTGDIFNMYGPTETAIWSTAYRIQQQRSSIPIGKPIVNTQVYVLDAELQPVPAGEVGDLFIGGDGVVRGYWNRPELTAERFLSDPFEPGGRMYRTGDLARFLGDGDLECLGREDFQVKIRGFRIELGEIEATLERQAGVAQAVVVAREDRQGDQVLAAYVVAKDGNSLNLEQLRGALGASLPGYMVPTYFVSLESLPLTANGKIDRNALPPLAAETHESATTGESPSGEFEQVLAAAWMEALGLKRVSRQDNFFQLGGHSLTALKIAFKCQQELHLDIPLQMFVEHPVLSEQARKLEEMLVEQADSNLLETFLADMAKDK